MNNKSLVIGTGIILLIVLALSILKYNISNFENLDKNDSGEKYICTSQGFDGETRYNLVNTNRDKITYSVQGTTGLHTFELENNGKGKFCGQMIHSTNPDYAFRNRERVCTEGVINNKLSFCDTTTNSTYATNRGKSFNHTYTCNQL